MATNLKLLLQHLLTSVAIASASALRDISAHVVLSAEKRLAVRAVLQAPSTDLIKVARSSLMLLEIPPTATTSTREPGARTRSTSPAQSDTHDEPGSSEEEACCDLSSAADANVKLPSLEGRTASVGARTFQNSVSGGGLPASSGAALAALGSGGASRV